MEIKLFNCKFYISFLFIAFMCLVLLVDTTGIMLFGLISVAIHEMGHLIFMLLCRKVPKSITFQLGGIIIQRSDGITSFKSDLAIAAGGCLFNLVTFIITIIIYCNYNDNPMLLLFCATNLSLLFFNILPIKGLDGTDIIKNILFLRMDMQRADKIINNISIGFLLLLFLISVAIICRTKSNYSLFICFCYLLVLALINIKR